VTIQKVDSELLVGGEMKTEPKTSGEWQGADRDPLAPEVIRLAMEVIEQAPAEALYAKLLRTLLEAGMEADLRGTTGASRKIAFAYKLTVELGGKLGVLSPEHLTRRRRHAATLFGEHEGSAFDAEQGSARDMPSGRPRRPAISG